VIRLEDKCDKVTAVGLILIIIILIVIAIIINNRLPTHSCDQPPKYINTEIEYKVKCVDVSDTNITCYTVKKFGGALRCNSGWEEIVKSDSND
jgi:hypothetical protein